MLLSRPVNVAIVGFGLGYKIQVSALKASRNIKLVACWHPCRKHLNSMKQHDEIYLHSEFNALLDNPAIEAVIIATHSKCYFNLAKATLNANKHILFDMPSYLDNNQIKELQDLALEKRLKIAVNFPYRSVPSFQQLAHLLHNGVLGDPYFIRVDWLLGINRKNSQYGHFHCDLNTNGSVIDRIGIHLFDLLHWLMGPILWVSVLNTNLKEENLIKIDYQSDLSGNIVLIQAKLQTLSGMLIPIQINLSSILQHERGFWMEFYGNQSTLIVGTEQTNDLINTFGLWMAPNGQPLRRLPIDPGLSFELKGDNYEIAPTRRIQDEWAASICYGYPMTPGLTEIYWSTRVSELIKMQCTNSNTVISNGCSTI